MIDLPLDFRPSGVIAMVNAVGWDTLPQGANKLRKGRGLVDNKRKVMYSSTHGAEIEDYPIADIDRDHQFIRLFDQAKHYTMTSKDVMFSTYQAAKYVESRGIAGDVVECGVWRGGSALLAALTMREVRAGRKRSLVNKVLGARRKVWLYDTFEGMTAPTDKDIDVDGVQAGQYMDQYSDDGKWCYASIEDVTDIFEKNKFKKSEIKMIKGDVLKTLKTAAPKKISLLRLDTDWYESTKAELEILYPRLSVGGVLIIDDYGHWAGARDAVDEYFAKNPSVLLNRISYAVRVAIKI
jgi:O-methyltransferase